ncbi:AbgT family transporter [Brevibacterium luteolum]|uniref:AbgT family transporter n=1 Tax=Brevibacterium luteolum TaxID=199591 RepID=UPI003B683A0A
MSTAAAHPGKQKSDEDLSWLMKALVLIERAGNKLPHPFWLFLSLAAIVMLLSWWLASAGVSAVNPADDKEVAVVNLLSTESLREIVSGITESYVTFPALGLVLVVLFGVAVAEQSGLFPTMMRAALSNVSPRLVTPVVALVGAAASIASDASYMIVIPLGGLAFKAVGRNPVIGCAVAYAAVSGGYSAAPFVNSLDAILGGISTSAAHIIDESYTVTPVANLYFNFVSMFAVALAITVVTELLLNKRGEQMELTEDNGNGHDASGTSTSGTDDGTAGRDVQDQDLSAPVTALEKRGMLITLVVAIIGVAACVAIAWPENSFLRDADGGFTMESGLMAGIAPLIGMGFFILGIVYGVVTGSIKHPNNVPEMMVKGVAPFVQVLVLFFAASQFLALFAKSNLGVILAIRGAEFFQNIGATTFLILIGGYLLTALGAMFITSGSGLWTLMAPVLIPMFMLLGIAPEITQAVYRIGDSTTNIISPMSPYFVMILGFIQRYKKDAGIGTLLSLTIPLSFAMFIVWGILFFIWWATGIPMGPGAQTGYEM